MNTFSEKKKLVVVYENKDELPFNYFKKLIETDDDDKESGVVVGSEDGSIQVIGWTEKVYLDNSKKGNITNKVIFLDDVKGVKNITPIMDKKFDKYGISYGFAGNQAVISIDESKIKDADMFEEMRSFFENDLKENGYKKSDDNNAQLVTRNAGNAKKKRTISIVVSALQPFYGIPFVINAVVTYKKLRNDMFIYAISKFYLDELDSFMKK